MNLHLLDKIKQQMPSFSKGQKSIANYIIEEYDKAAFMTAAKLGQMVGVSESTVVRFATELGYDGYPQLQKAMQEMIRSKLTILQRMEVSNNRIGDDVLARVLEQDVEKIKTTLEETSRQDFNRAVELITHARCIYIFGVGSSEALAVFLRYYFSLVFDNVIHVITSSETAIFEQMLRIGSEDVLIGISFPRYSRRAVKAARFANDRGANVIAITDSMASPMARQAGCVLLARSDMVSFADSLVAPLSLINALIAAVGIQMKDQVNDTFTELERLWEEYKVYEKPESETW
ncbi:MurR/RpiR family transcriptional regulator [Solibaculum mannosilyticum]|uniref:N-acetylmannosamine kinase n=1 Tax=Solibaculum mannosilyticum TaxID=2780922 RepID=A0A7I8D4K6_9FIRM|nr:MurR/RpiR family transcriptional regulator [Solibaculum mannosilyticum]MCO7136987.1 MurR/RpiR family transcriptional regulator [[Clostridium] leptum]BCI60975.1 N-acetylmannosamine kinase [Solibaculum mannosilyticum]CZT55481.1 HTH-type transcriptional regulator MurR [Eubacteriaceae bacterium CHKCI005]